MPLARLLFVLLSVAAAARAVGQPGPRPHVVDDVDQATLTAAALDRALAPYLLDVRTCYVAKVRSPSATGHLRVELIILRDGSLARLTAAAPGVPAKERRRLDSCLLKVSKAWSFPIRRGSTIAVVPFYFQRTRAPDAGPWPSCWSRRGCPGPRHQETR